MAVARHAMPPELAQLSLEEIAERYIGRFRDKVPDWAAFEDAKIEGYRRAQHRFIGAGGSGKHDDPSTIPPRGFTLSIIFCPPGQGNAAHTHEVEEVFFVLQGMPRRVHRGRGRPAPDAAPRALGMHRVPAGRDPRLPERQSRARLFSGHARPRPSRHDGLCRRQALQPPRRAPEIGVRAARAPGPRRARGRAARLVQR